MEALDPTGAGDVFVAGFVTGTLAGWPLADRLAFAGLTAALSVQEFGGSLSAPGWARSPPGGSRVQSLEGQDQEPGGALRRYAFLEDLLPERQPAPGRCAGRYRRSASALGLNPGSALNPGDLTEQPGRRRLNTAAPGRPDKRTAQNSYGTVSPPRRTLGNARLPTWQASLTEEDEQAYRAGP